MGRAAAQLTSSVQRRREARAHARRRIEHQIRLVIQRFAPKLAAETSGAGLSEKELSQILDSLGTESGVDNIKQTGRILRRVLIELRDKTRGPVALPPMEITLHRPTSPFAGGSISALGALHQAVESFLDDIRESPDVEMELAAGRILFSSIVFGGLLHSTLVRALPAALNCEFQAHKKLCWIDLGLDSSDADRTVRRWFPDPVSQCLILRWNDSHQTWPQHQPERLLRTLLTDLGCDKKAAILQLSGLLEASETRLRLHLPAVLVDFLASVRRGQSLPPRAWWRVLADYQLAADEEADDEANPLELLTVDPQPPTSYVAVTQSSSLDQLVLDQFLACLRTKDKKNYRKRTAAIRAMEQCRDSNPTVGAMLMALMNWSIWRLQAWQKSSIQPSSLKRYLGSFAKPLLNFAGELDPGATPAETLEERYRQILQSVSSPKERSIASFSLRQFHAFLLVAVEAEPVAIDGMTIGGQHVRANMVSDVEFTVALRTIKASDLPFRIMDMFALMLIFLYRLGLRRNELRYIRLNDIQYDEHWKRPLLWIHGHPDRRLKSSSSTRRLPLAHLLRPDEQHTLLQWRRLRLAECQHGQAAQSLLFCFPGVNTEPVPDPELDMLVKLIRDVGQDESLVLHSLRHSFACNLFDDIMVQGWSVDNGQLGAKTVKAALPWRTQPPYADPLHRLFAADQLPRGAAYLIAVIAGHLDPAESLNTYIHHQDYVAHLYLRELASDIPKTLWANFEGITPQALSVRHARTKRKTGNSVRAYLDTPERLLVRARIALPNGSFADPGRTVSTLDSCTEEHPAQRNLEAVYQALATASHPMTVHTRQILTGMDNSTFSLLLKNARFLAARKTRSRNKPGRRSRLTAPTPKRRRPRITRLPQLDTVGPAIPKTILERSDARLTFKQATDPTNAIDYPEILDLLDHTSHSDPVVACNSIDAVKSASQLLSRLGISYNRQRIVIRSLPKTCQSAEQWLKEVKREIGNRACRVELGCSRECMPRSNSTNPQGRLAIEVAGERSLSYGWRVGCFYATCVLATDCIDDLGTPASDD